MYLYIYDSFLAQSKYDRTLKDVENRLTHLGIDGKISRLNIVKKTTYIIENSLKKGLKTLVVVGDDATINQISNILAELSSLVLINKTVLGIVPIGKNNTIAQSLGIDFGVAACDILAQRRTIKLDLGLVNNTNYFISQASFRPKKNVTLKINKQYSLEISKGFYTNIINLPAPSLCNRQTASCSTSPQDGKLELLIEEKKKSLWSKQKKTNNTILSFRNLTIDNYPYSLLFDNFFKVDVPVEIKVVREKIDVIAGKNRQF